MFDHVWKTGPDGTVCTKCGVLVDLAPAQCAPVEHSPTLLDHLHTQSLCGLDNAHRVPALDHHGMQPRQYVCGFAMNEHDVLLIKKNKPAWQAGKYNGIGGKVEHYDASPAYAMEREFYEETGQHVGALCWVHFHTERFATGTVVYFFYAKHVARALMADACRWTHERTQDVRQPVEQCHYRSWRDIAGPFGTPGIMYNLPYLLAMAACHQQCVREGRDADNGLPWVAPGLHA
jgi:8-oxo-dGTP pyrophosphatase MutT (NUDIX family)